MSTVTLPPLQSGSYIIMNNLNADADAIQRWKENAPDKWPPLYFVTTSTYVQRWPWYSATINPDGSVTMQTSPPGRTPYNSSPPAPKAS
jgi:hypothetical protein